MTALRFSRLLANARGAAVIELALVAPVLALGVIGIVDVSNAYSRKLALEQGAQRAVEKIMNTTETSTVEATLANNRRLATVDRGGGPYRVLYVGGRPNWEFKFLRRAVE